MTRLGVMTAPATTRRGRRMKSRGDLVVGTRIKDLERRGIRVRNRAVRVIDDTVVLQDGTRVQPRTVIWATGFRRDHSWLEVEGAFGRDGAVAHVRGWSDVPGLSFIGLPWQHTRGSALLGFVKDDAAWLAARIDLRLAAGTATRRAAVQSAALLGRPTEPCDIAPDLTDRLQPV
jgi:putative flavoprotein involved in K+ transport